MWCWRRGMQRAVASLVTFLAALPLTQSGQVYMLESGCADHTTEGFQDSLHPKVAACDGEWRGHVETASSLCSLGWRVCGWKDTRLLQAMNWKDATSLPGCYAINAAQDGGQCRPCISDLEQDDMGGVGRGCPHQSYGQKSCISGGQIDVSCCIDTHFNRSCTYRPGLATGVLCCRVPGVPPQILVRPQALTHVTTGVTFVLSCQAMGTPTPTVTWFKDGQILPSNSSRVAVFDSGYLLISEAQSSDSGHYTCVVSNEVANDTAPADVIVTEYRSGCADGTTDGFYQLEDIHACYGSWEGHVKRGRSLCARGWHVCNPRHNPLLKMLTWSDVTSLDGCYAYNAANSLNQCTRCFQEDMAGVGNKCGRIRRSYRSCLAQGRIDVFKSRHTVGCYYQPGITTGVLCCRKKKNIEILWRKRPKCRPKCANGGECVSEQRCQCATGYKGAWCQNPICHGGCIPNSTCVKPGVCRCRPGHIGKKCRQREFVCKAPCLNGGRCKEGRCKCPNTHRGAYCQSVVKWRPLAEMNRTER